jgi:hypothetical protein
MRKIIASIVLKTVVIALPHQVPISGDNGNMGGIFGLPIPVPGFPSSVSSLVNMISGLIPDLVPLPDPNTLAAYLNIDPILSSVFAKPKEYPREKITVADFYNPGTGPYPAHLFTVPGLPSHVIYAPKQRPPEEIRLPTMVWGNGLCLSSGTAYGPFLMEVASHGYIVIATGPTGAPPPSLEVPSGILPGPNGELRDRKEGQVLNGFSGVKDMLDSIKFVSAGNLDKYGNIDKETFITAGSSCGGLEAYSAAYHNPKVKLIGVYNSGVINSRKRPLLRELKAKVAYITGGPEDISWQNVSSLLHN